MENIYEIRNLNVSYKRKFPWKDPKEVLRNVSIDIPLGKIVVILGGNGSGKSTLLKAIVNSTENDFDRRAQRSGEIRYKDTNILKKGYSISGYQRQISYTRQSNSCDYYESSDTVSEVLIRRAEDCAEKKDKDKTSKKVSDMLEYFNASNIAKTNVRSLSGGQMRLLSIMECLIKDDANVYFVDEPYNDLDDDRARRVSNYLMDMHDSRPDISIVVITHCKKIPNGNNDVIAYHIEDGMVSPTKYNHVLCLGEMKNNRYILN